MLQYQRKSFLAIILASFHTKEENIHNLVHSKKHSINYPWPVVGWTKRSVAHDR